MQVCAVGECLWDFPQIEEDLTHVLPALRREQCGGDQVRYVLPAMSPPGVFIIGTGRGWGVHRGSSRVCFVTLRAGQAEGPGGLISTGRGLAVRSLGFPGSPSDAEVHGAEVCISRSPVRPGSS